MTPSRQEAIRAALLAAARGRTPDDLGRRAGVSARTVQRLLGGKTFSEATVEKVARVLRVDVDSVVPLARQDAPEGAKTRQNAPELSPVVGWKAAAEVLGVSLRHLVRFRARFRAARKAWWATREAVLRWYEALLVGSVRVEIRR